MGRSLAVELGVLRVNRSADRRFRRRRPQAIWSGRLAGTGSAEMFCGARPAFRQPVSALLPGRIPR